MGLGVREAIMLDDKVDVSPVTIDGMATVSDKYGGMLLPV